MSTSRPGLARFLPQPSTSLLAKDIKQSQSIAANQSLAHIRSSLLTVNRKEVNANPNLLNIYKQLCHNVGIDPLSGPPLEKEEIAVQLFEIFQMSHSFNGGVLSLAALSREISQTRQYHISQAQISDAVTYLSSMGAWRCDKPSGLVYSSFSHSSSLQSMAERLGGRIYFYQFPEGGLTAVEVEEGVWLDEEEAWYWGGLVEFMPMPAVV